MRIRTVKPEFHQSETLAQVSREVRGFAAALLNWCDDEGYFRSHPALIAGSLYPFDTDGAVFVTSGLRRLASIGYVELFEGGVGRITNFSHHQVINKPSKSKLRERAVTPVVLPEDSRSPTVVLPEHSHTEVEVEVEVEQGSGSGGGREPAAPAKTPPPPLAVVKPPLAGLSLAGMPVAGVTGLQLNLQPPDKPPDAWGAGDFWAWAQCLRRDDGHTIEAWPGDDALGRWWRDARALADVDALRVAYAEGFGADKHWEKTKPPYPWRGWVAQWTQYLPKGAVNVAR